MDISLCVDSDVRSDVYCVAWIWHLGWTTRRLGTSLEIVALRDDYSKKVQRCARLAENEKHGEDR